MKTNLPGYSRKAAVAASFCSLFFAAAGARAQEPRSAVKGISGVKQDAVDRIKPIEPVPPPPPPSSHAQAVNKVDGVDTIDGVKATGHAAPVSPPPPPTATTTRVGGVVSPAGNIQAIHGVAGINTAKMQNLEAALILKHEGEVTPADGGAEHGGKGKAAAAALLAAPPGKPLPKIGPKEDGRAGFQEFEKLQNRGS